MLPKSTFITLLLVSVLLGNPVSAQPTDTGGTRLSLLTGTAVAYRPCNPGEGNCIQPIGALVMGSVNAIDYKWLHFYVSYGASIKQYTEVHQALAGGVQYEGVLKVNVFGGAEMGYELIRYRTPYPWFVGAALQIGGFDLDLTNILSGETDKTLMEDGQ